MRASEDMSLHLAFIRVDTSPEEGGLPAVHFLLGVTGQLDLTQIFVHIPGGRTHNSSAQIRKIKDEHDIVKTSPPLFCIEDGKDVLAGHEAFFHIPQLQVVQRQHVLLLLFLTHNDMKYINSSNES